MFPFWKKKSGVFVLFFLSLSDDESGYKMGTKAGTKRNITKSSPLKFR
jgi:hypothetical protein